MTVAGGAPGTARDGYRGAAPEAALCDLLVAPCTTCGEPVFEDSERCATHYARFLEELARRLVRELDESRAAVRAGLALHRPWYEIDGVRHENTVNVGCEQFDGCDGDADMWCADSDGDGHEVLACSECRCVVDYDIDGFLLWPCPTYRALAAPLAGQHTTDEETDR